MPFFCLLILSSFCLSVDLKTTNLVPLHSPTGIRICDAICLEGGYRLLHGECHIVSLLVNGLNPGVSLVRIVGSSSECVVLRRTVVGD